MIQTNPHHAPGWVAIARLEELAGNMAEARKLLQEVSMCLPFVMHPGVEAIILIQGFGCWL